MEASGVIGRTKEGMTVLMVGQPDQTRPAVGVINALNEMPVSVTEMTPGEFVPQKRVADVVMIFFGSDEDSSLKLVQREAECDPRPSIFAVLHEQSPTLTRRVLRAGADEVLFLPLLPVELVRPLLKVSESLRRHRQLSGAKVFSVGSLAGGVGVSTLCSNIGFALLGQGDGRVVLVDLDLQEGGLGSLFGVNPDRGIAALTRIGHKPDSISLEAALTRHDSGLYVLGAPARIEESDQVTEALVGNLLQLMRGLFDFIVVDCGGHIDGRSLAVWEGSQEVLYVIDQSIAAVNRAARFLALFRRLGIEELEPRIVLNRYQRGHAISDAQIETSLGSSVYGYVPRDDRAMEKAVAMGRLAAQIAPGCAMVRGCEHLARRLSGDPELDPRPQRGPGWRLVGRLFSNFGAGA